jgi:hypothetical protein
MGWDCHGVSFGFGRFMGVMGKGVDANIIYIIQEELSKTVTAI